MNSFFIEIDFKFNVQKKSLNLLIHTFAIVKKQHLHKITPWNWLEDKKNWSINH